MRKSIHFIGIGGAGMSALARYFLSQKWAVSGSDIGESPIIAGLRKEGVKVKIGQKRAHIRAEMTLVIYSQAIRPNNPELKEARRLARQSFAKQNLGGQAHQSFSGENIGGSGIQVLSYPEAIGKITRQYKTVTVSGAHGKSTTAALAALILEKGGLDPTVIMGANLKKFGGKNFRHGKSDCLVLEADEFGRAFLHYSPTYAVITNIDREHLDIYKNLTDIKKTFMRFLANTRDGGTVIINRDDKNCRSLKKKITALARQSFAKQNLGGQAHRKKLRIIWYSLRDPAYKKIKKNIQIPGKHNVSNALAAYHLGRTLKISEKDILAAIHAYHGVDRRMEYRGKFKVKNEKISAQGGSSSGRKMEISVYDDYAHHPTEIKATLRAFHEKFPSATIACVFQPHQAKRLKALFKEFQNAFDDANITLILPLYKVPGRDKEVSSLDSEALVHAMQKRRSEKLIFYLNNPKKMSTALNTLLSSPKLRSSKLKNDAPQTILVMMGAGNIVQYTDALLKK
jgi:UDP-N-acetylmuramate--alanine ligase